MIHRKIVKIEMFILHCLSAICVPELAAFTSTVVSQALNMLNTNVRLFIQKHVSLHVSVSL
jgi:hypothetical protein